MSNTEVMRGLSGNQVKLIAILSMLTDHIVWTLCPGYDNKAWYLIALHIFGRLAAPTMWFMISEGYSHTRNFKRYLTRLFVFAIISHFAYNFCFGIPFVPFRNTVFNQTSVIWALFCAALALYIDDDERRAFKLRRWQKAAIIILLCVLAFPSDWSCFPVLCTLHIHRNRGNLEKQVLGMLGYISMYVIVWCLEIDVVYGLVQFGIVIVYPLMRLYNGTRGKSCFMKWFFYVFYVGHLFILGAIRILMYGNITTIIG